MNIFPFPFQVTDWEKIETIEYSGETGKAYWKTQYFGEENNKIRVRVVEYSANYLADHWCEKFIFYFVLRVRLKVD